MSQDSEKYERLVAFAGWLWTRVRDGKPVFRRSDLVHVESLAYLGTGGAASRQAFGRAVADLDTFGITVEWDDSVPNDADPNSPGAYRTTGLKLTPDQQQALVGLSFAIAYRDLETDRALRIPGSFLDGAGDTLLLEANRFVAPIAEAIDDRRCLSIRYKDDTEHRDLQPIQLGFQRGTWYLSAYEFSSEITKVFRLDGIRDVADSSAEWFEGNDTDDARAMVSRATDRFFWGDGETQRVVLAVDPDAELSAQRLLPGLELLGVRDDGHLVMARQYSNAENVLDAVLTLGHRSEIVEPPELRRAIIGHLSAMAEAGA